MRGIATGALVQTCFGAGWLGWGMGVANAFSPATTVLFDAVLLVLIVGSVVLLKKGKAISRRAAPATPQENRFGRSYWIVVVTEFVAIGVAVGLALAFHRAELMPVGIAFIVGVHFLPLARIFRALIYYFTGSAVAAWSLGCWIMVSPARMAVWVGIGTGSILWLSAAYALLRAASLTAE
jgi:hypothetical protein